MKESKIQVINSIILVIILIILTFNLTLMVCKKINRKKYIYVDMTGSTGTSENCYYSDYSRTLRCIVSMEVQQYTEE